MAKRVLITGHDGYIGSVMTPIFQDAGYEVTGLDTGYFHDCTLIPDKTSAPVISKDIRDIELSDLKSFDAVVHLAALSNDPIGNLNREWTEAINTESSVKLARYAKAAGVQRFLFSSSCIMYGMSEVAVVNEESPLDPKTEYAASKVKAEREITKLAGDGFSPTFMRNGTIYGLSPRMRFDTVFNNLMGMAVATGKVTVQSDGKPWRPVIHVQDIARSFLAVLEAPVSAVHNQVFNNGANHLNHQVMTLAQVALKTVPGCKLETISASGADQRTYRADFGKFARTFPDFKFKWDIEEGARELYKAFKKINLTQAQFYHDHFTRIKWLRYLLESGRLDGSLRWKKNGGPHL